MRAAFTRIRILDKEPLLSGQEPTWTDISRFPDPMTGQIEHVIMQPAIHYGQAGPFFLVSVTPGFCEVSVWALSVSLSGQPRIEPALASTTLEPLAEHASSCARPPNALQPDGLPPLRIDHSPVLSSPAIYRQGSLWVAQHLAMDFGSGPVAAVRMMEIDVSEWPEAVSLKQDVILGEDAVWNFFPALAVNEDGNVALTFARSAEEEYPSAYYSGRLASDPLNTLRAPRLLRAGNAGQSVGEGCCGGYRWGDYFGAAIDPVDGTAWLIGEYTETATLWGTWIGQIAWRPSGES